MNSQSLLGHARRVPVLARLRDQLLVVVGAAALTLTFFLVLPLIQAIAKTPTADLVLTTIDPGSLPPPTPPPPPEEPDEPEPEEPPPELIDDSPPLDLAELALALNPGSGLGWMGGDFGVKLDSLGRRNKGEAEALFSLADLDQKPRAVYQPNPVLSSELRRKAPGTVYVLFVVDQDGRVETPLVQRSSDPVFDRPALDAVRKWKFEPGKRSGKPVRFRMRVPITFRAT